jgi:hypothetical protein
MRHVRTLVVLGTLITLGAVGTLTAAPALASSKCHINEHEYVNKRGEVTCESTKEHEQFQSFTYCPFHEPPLNSEFTETQGCDWALSSYKEKWSSTKAKETWEATFGRPAPDEGSEFTAGNITVPLRNPIILLGGFEENEETGEEAWLGAIGAPTIEPVAQAGPRLTKAIDKEKLSPSELERYDYYVQDARQTKTTVTIELAGPATGIELNAANLVEETGTAFSFPVKVKLGNAFLGESCYVGSNEHPIVVEYTTGTAGELRGKTGPITGGKNGFILSIPTSTLVSNTFETPGAEGCGIGGGADEALDAALGFPSPAGHNTSVLNGALKQIGAELAEEGLRGEI